MKGEAVTEARRTKRERRRQKKKREEKATVRGVGARSVDVGKGQDREGNRCCTIERG